MDKVTLTFRVLPVLVAAILALAFGTDILSQTPIGDFLAELETDATIRLRFPAATALAIGFTIAFAAVFLLEWYFEARAFYTKWLEISDQKRDLMPMIWVAYKAWPLRDPSIKDHNDLLDRIPFPKAPVPQPASPEWRFIIELCEQIEAQKRGDLGDAWLQLFQMDQFDRARNQLAQLFQGLSEGIQGVRILKRGRIKEALQKDCRVVKALAYLGCGTAMALRDNYIIPGIIKDFESIYIPRQP